MGNTDENLKSAFAGESQANRKYTAFAKKAEEEGFPNTAKLFRAVAEAETIHALNHLKLMNEIKTTRENLRAAVNGETYEFTEMYPSFIKTSNQEKASAATVSFDHANQVEMIHEKLYQKALQSIGQNKDMEKKEIFVCQVCGNTVGGEALDVCPICGSPKEMFKKIL